MAFSQFGLQFGMGPPEEYGDAASMGNPSGYGGKVFTNKSELIVAVIVVAVLFMLIAGVISLRASGEVVI